MCTSLQGPSQYATNPKPHPLTPPRLHHATFMTMDVDLMVRFYELVCGLQPVYYSPHAAWLTNDEANHRFAVVAMPGTIPPADKPLSAGLHHTGFEYATLDQWLDNYVRLRDQGVTPVQCLDHGMTMSMYYVDPDGNGVELQVDAFGDWEASKEWMWGSPEFAADVHGAYFDPDLLVQARAGGMSRAEIHAATRAGAYAPADPDPSLRLPDPWPARLAAAPSLADGVPGPPGPAGAPRPDAARGADA